MYTPLHFAKMMDLCNQPYNNKWIRAIKQTLLDIDEVLLFIWYDTDFMNPSYSGKFKYINDILLSGRSQMYKIMTGNSEIPKDPEEDRALAAELFSSYLMPNKWAANKQVYKFDSELELALADSEEIKLPVRILDRLPYQTFYLEFAENGIFRKNFHGAFVNIVREGNGYLLYAERIKEDGIAPPPENVSCLVKQHWFQTTMKTEYLFSTKMIFRAMNQIGMWIGRNSVSIC